MQAALGRFDASHFGAGLEGALGDAKRMLADLPAKREAVSALGIPGPEAIGYYTKTIAALLAVPAATAPLARMPEVSKLASAYGAYLQAKERAGIERALLSNILGADRFAPDMLVRFLSNAAVQETWFGVFESYATDAQKAFHKAKVAGTAVDEVARTKKAAIDRMSEPALGMDAKAWFSAATGRIDLLKEVESRLASDLTGGMSVLEKEAELTAWAYGIVTVLATLLVLWVARRFSQTIVGQIGGEPETAVEVAHAVAGGKLDNLVELRPGDTASILASMKTMQEQLLARTETERRQANESLRIKIALDNVSTGVMIADTDRRIIYTNRSVQSLLKAAEADIRKELPNFDADRLVGSNIDGFHKDPSHQAKLLSTFTKTYTANLEVGGRFMTVSANPVINEAGERIGSVAEWRDRTDEVAVEREEGQHVEDGDLRPRTPRSLPEPVVIQPLGHLRERPVVHDERDHELHRLFFARILLQVKAVGRDA